MTDEAERVDAGEGAAGAASGAGRREDRRQTVGVAIALFVLTFAVYWLLGPQRTPYDFQLSQANNMIHGHLEMTEQYTHNLGILERVLYDGIGFCLPADDPRGPERAADLPPGTRFTDNCRHYMQHSLGPALMLVPLAMLWGLDVNQTLISVIVAALTSLFVFAITRRFSDRLLVQVALTALAMFGTILWWVGANGGVWFFAHTTAVFFLFAAIWATVVRRSPLMAGLFIGAAFMCRPTTILAGVFPLIVFSEQWLVGWSERVPPWRRIRLGPLVQLAAGVTPFVLLTGALNLGRFNSPFESGYNYTEQLYQISLAWRWPHGFFDISYLGRHVQVVFEQMPNVASQGSYVWPSWSGLAMWATTPAFLYGLFIHLRRLRRVTVVAAFVLAAACLMLLVRGIATGLGLGGDWATEEIPFSLHLLPFWLLIGAAVAGSILARDRLAFGAWAAILVVSFADWLFAATGWAQFGYRYGLDFTPFLWLLVVLAVGRGPLRWHHWALIGLAVLVNLWGVLWIYKFDPVDLFGWTWVSY